MSTIAQLKARAKQIEFANTIGQREFDPNQTLQVLSASRVVYWSWGVSNRASFGNKALMLQVNGAYHKGKVWIVLAWDDTYTVHITTNQNRILKTFEMVYFDMLAGIIDGYIETRRK